MFQMEIEFFYGWKWIQHEERKSVVDWHVNTSIGSDYAEIRCRHPRRISMIIIIFKICAINVFISKTIINNIINEIFFTINQGSNAYLSKQIALPSWSSRSLRWSSSPRLSSTTKSCQDHHQHQEGPNLRLMGRHWMHLVVTASLNELVGSSLSSSLSAYSKLSQTSLSSIWTSPIWNCILNIIDITFYQELKTISS